MGRSSSKTGPTGTDARARVDQTFERRVAKQHRHDGVDVVEEERVDLVETRPRRADLRQNGGAYTNIPVGADPSVLERSIERTGAALPLAVAENTAMWFDWLAT